MCGTVNSLYGPDTTYHAAAAAAAAAATHNQRFARRANEPLKQKVGKKLVRIG